MMAEAVANLQDVVHHLRGELREMSKVVDELQEKVARLEQAAHTQGHGAHSLVTRQ